MTRPNIPRSFGITKNGSTLRRQVLLDSSLKLLNSQSTQDDHDDSDEHLNHHSNSLGICSRSQLDPCVNPVSAVAAQRGWKLRQLDVVAAYLNAAIDNCEVYANMPL